MLPLPPTPAPRARPSFVPPLLGLEKLIPPVSSRPPIVIEYNKSGQLPSYPPTEFAPNNKVSQPKPTIVPPSQSNKNTNPNNSLNVNVNVNGNTNGISTVSNSRPTPHAPRVPSSSPSIHRTPSSASAFSTPSITTAVHSSRSLSSMTSPSHSSSASSSSPSPSSSSTSNRPFVHHTVASSHALLSKPIPIASSSTSSLLLLPPSSSSSSSPSSSSFSSTPAAGPRIPHNVNPHNPFGSIKRGPPRSPSVHQKRKEEIANKTFHDLKPDVMAKEMISVDGRGMQVQGGNNNNNNNYNTSPSASSSLSLSGSLKGFSSSIDNNNNNNNNGQLLLMSSNINVTDSKKRTPSASSKAKISSTPSSPSPSLSPSSSSPPSFPSTINVTNITNATDMSSSPISPSDRDWWDRTHPLDSLIRTNPSEAFKKLFPKHKAKNPFEEKENDNETHDDNDKRTHNNKNDVDDDTNNNDSSHHDEEEKTGEENLNGSNHLAKGEKMNGKSKVTNPISMKVKQNPITKEKENQTRKQMKNYVDNNEEKNNDDVDDHHLHNGIEEDVHVEDFVDEDESVSQTKLSIIPSKVSSSPSFRPLLSSTSSSSSLEDDKHLSSLTKTPIKSSSSVMGKELILPSSTIKSNSKSNIPSNLRENHQNEDDHYDDDFDIGGEDQNSKTSTSSVHNDHEDREDDHIHLSVSLSPTSVDRVKKKTLNDNNKNTKNDKNISENPILDSFDLDSEPQFSSSPLSESKSSSPSLSPSPSPVRISKVLRQKQMDMMNPIGEDDDANDPLIGDFKQKINNFHQTNEDIQDHDVSQEVDNHHHHDNNKSHPKVEYHDLGVEADGESHIIPVKSNNKNSKFTQNSPPSPSGPLSFHLDLDPSTVLHAHNDNDSQVSQDFLHTADFSVSTPQDEEKPMKTIPKASAPTSSLASKSQKSSPITLDDSFDLSAELHTLLSSPSQPNGEEISSKNQNSHQGEGEAEGQEGDHDDFLSPSSSHSPPSPAPSAMMSTAAFKVEVADMGANDNANTITINNAKSIKSSSSAIKTNKSSNPSSSSSPSPSLSPSSSSIDFDLDCDPHAVHQQISSSPSTDSDSLYDHSVTHSQSSKTQQGQRQGRKALPSEENQNIHGEEIDEDLDFGTESVSSTQAAPPSSSTSSSSGASKGFFGKLEAAAHGLFHKNEKEKDSVKPKEKENEKETDKHKKDSKGKEKDGKGKPKEILKETPQTSVKENEDSKEKKEKEKEKEEEKILKSLPSSSSSSSLSPHTDPPTHHSLLDKFSFHRPNHQTAEKEKQAENGKMKEKESSPPSSIPPVGLFSKVQNLLHHHPPPPGTIQKHKIPTSHHHEDDEEEKEKGKEKEKREEGTKPKMDEKDPSVLVQKVKVKEIPISSEKIDNIPSTPLIQNTKTSTSSPSPSAVTTPAEKSLSAPYSSSASSPPITLSPSQNISLTSQNVSADVVAVAVPLAASSSSSHSPSPSPSSAVETKKNSNESVSVGSDITHDKDNNNNPHDHQNNKGGELVNIQWNGHTNEHTHGTKNHPIHTFHPHDPHVHWTFASSSPIFITSPSLPSRSAPAHPSKTIQTQDQAVASSSSPSFPSPPPSSNSFSPFPPSPSPSPSPLSFPLPLPLSSTKSVTPSEALAALRARQAEIERQWRAKQQT